MNRWICLFVGLVAYVSFLAVFGASAAFVGGVFLPRTIDGPATSPPGVALAVNLALLLAFGLQHSVMARPGFKALWTRLVPAPAERSVYVLASNAAMIALLLLWRPIDGVVWHVESPALRTAAWTLFALGWLSVPLASLAIDHLELFGVRQAWRHFRGVRHTAPVFRAPGPYRLVRHPLYVAWMLAFWVTPTMTVGHLLFAAVTTAYMLVAIRLEERDLLQVHGREYADWRATTPMLVPRLARAAAPEEREEAATSPAR